MIQSAKSAFVLGLMTLFAAKAQGTILPDNDLYLMDCIECETGIGKEEFDRIIANAEKAFGPIVEKFGSSLEIVNKWNDSTVNASATQSFGTWTVNMYGGLARRPEVTADGFVLVLCHELGHHLGGFPYVSNWGANEGQSDYFASNHCAPYLWAEETAINATFRNLIPKAPKDLCDTSYPTVDQQNLCYRTMLASKSISDLLGSLTGRTVDFNKPSPTQVKKTVNSHPEAQCRLDTYMAGSLCSLEYDREVIPGQDLGRGNNGLEAEKQSAVTNCADPNLFSSKILRPRCWFKPGV